MICRVLPHETAAGPENMGLDHALLDAVDGEPTAAVLRTYGWSEPTLSLGYFQGWAEAREGPRWRGVPTVRRPSGGGALWHDREITYALVVPRSHAAAARASALYRAVHEAIGGLLRRHGVAAARRGGAGAEKRSGRPFLCFTDHDPEDIVCSGVKIVGSAQRRRPGAVLQHGSLLLGRSATTPELPGLRELAGAAATLPWSDLLPAAIAGALGLEARVDAVAPPERARAERLASAVYRDPAWTGRR